MNARSSGFDWTKRGFVALACGVLAACAPREDDSDYGLARDFGPLPAAMSRAELVIEDEPQAATVRVRDSSAEWIADLNAPERGLRETPRPSTRLQDSSRVTEQDVRLALTDQVYENATIQALAHEAGGVCAVVVSNEDQVALAWSHRLEVLTAPRPVTVKNGVSYQSPVPTKSVRDLRTIELGFNRPVANGGLPRRNLQTAALHIRDDGAIAGLLAWQAEPGAGDSSQVSARVEVEMLFVDNDRVRRVPLATWDDQEFVSKAVITSTARTWWFCTDGRRLALWTVDDRGATSPLRNVAGSVRDNRGTTHQATMLRLRDGVLVAWLDSSEAYLIGWPLPQMRPLSAHRQVAVRAVTRDAMDRVRLLTPKQGTVMSFDAKATQAGPALAWLWAPVDRDDPENPDLRNPPRVQAWLDAP